MTIDDVSKCLQRCAKCFDDGEICPYENTSCTDILRVAADLFKEQNVFTCPVKPGQFVYYISGKKILVLEIEEIHFTRDGGWWASFFDSCYDTDLIAADEGLWMHYVFPTLELAEKKLKEMQQ